MKKTLLLIVLMAGVYQLKAQNFIPLNPADSGLANRIKKFKVKPFDSLLTLKHISPLFKPNGLTGQASLLAMSNISISPFDHMPIYKLRNNSKMPVYNLFGNSKMPVIDPVTKQRLDNLKKPEVIEVPKP